MANIAFKKGLVAALPNTYKEGTFYVTTDERAIYLDISDSARIRLGDFIEVAALSDLPAVGANVNALYYVSGINCLAKWNGTEWIQINRDTGATTFEVVGDGNAVTAVSYDPATRKVTLTKGATYMTSGDVDSKISTAVGDLGNDPDTSAPYANVKAYVDAKTEGIATDAALSELQEKVTAAEGDIDDLEKASHTHANKTELDKIADGDVAKWNAEIGSAAAITAMKDGATVVTFKGVEEALAGKQATGDYATKTEAQGYADAKDEAIAAAKKAGDDAMAEAQAKVASVAAGDASVTIGGTSTAPTVAAKLSADANNALELAEDGLKVVIPAAAEYSIVKAAESGDYAAVYNLTKDGTVVGASINIPKDMVVESGSVVENPEGQAAGTYIKLVLQNVAEPLYINVGSLIEYVTSGSAAGDMVVVAVSDDHKVTATITDGSITLAKLHADVQTAIGKAHDHSNKAVLDEITADDLVNWDDAVAKEHVHDNKALLDTYTQTEANLADAVAKKHEHANKAELDLIASGDKAKWDAAAVDAAAIKADYLKAADKTELEGDIATAQAAAEKVANDNNAAMDTRVKALEAIDHDAYKAYADQAEADALASAKAYTDTALTWGSF